MLSLGFEAEDETAIKVPYDLQNIECHLSVLQLRKAQRQTPITSYFRTSMGVAGVAEATETLVGAE